VLKSIISNILLCILGVDDSFFEKANRGSLLLHTSPAVEEDIP
jgi:hypothetical protein